MPGRDPARPTTDAHWGRRCCSRTRPPCSAPRGAKGQRQHASTRLPGASARAHREAGPASLMDHQPMSRPRVRLTARLLVCVLLTAGAVSGAGPASAHTEVVSSTPAAGATLAGPLDAVQIVFRTAVSPGKAVVVVIEPDGSNAGVGVASVSGNTVTQPLGPWSYAGDYTVAYRVVAADGHPIDGQVPFTVALSAVGGPAAAPSEAAAGASSAGEAQQGGQDGQGAQAARTTEASRGADRWLVPVLLAVLAVIAVALAVGAVRSVRLAGKVD